LLKHIGVDEPEAQRHIEQVAGRLLETINYTYSIHQKIYQVTASIGIAVFGNDAIDDVNDILRHADSAMYEAKRQGKACHVFFTPVIESRLQRKLHMETALRKSLEKKEFTLMFQKQVDFRGKIVGVEALIRWNHPTEGEISPHEFIPLAEETGLILPIGEWVLDRACHVLSQWQAQPQFASLKLSINCSAIEFMQEDYAQKVIDTVEAYGVDPERLTLEITESLLMTDNETLLETMNQLNDFGITLAIDDFGTGYSSLAYIKKFPIGILKIDQSFLEDIVDAPSDRTLVKAIISVAKDFNMSIIAEGVETREQIEVLHALGGDEIIGQGYFYGKPVPLEVFEKTLLNGTSKTV
jgi:EAL domain-containing protein (putative c-di-GMP-specific phosphodiesterase class I)